VAIVRKALNAYRSWEPRRGRIFGHRAEEALVVGQIVSPAGKEGESSTKQANIWRSSNTDSTSANKKRMRKHKDGRVVPGVAYHLTGSAMTPEEKK